MCFLRFGAEIPLGYSWGSRVEYPEKPLIVLGTCLELQALGCRGLGEKREIRWLSKVWPSILLSPHSFVAKYNPLEHTSQQPPRLVQRFSNAPTPFHPSPRGSSAPHTPLRQAHPSSTHPTGGNELYGSMSRVISRLILSASAQDPQWQECRS